MTLPELIAALEAATEPSRELDCEIALAVNAVPPNYIRRGVVEASATADWWDDDTGLHWSAPAYTDSLDAAMTTARNAAEGLVMLSATFHAATGGKGGFEKWPSIKATMIAALTLRKLKP